MTPDVTRLRATVEHLASYRTRNTLSPLHREAAGWLAEQLSSLPGIQVETMSYTLPVGKRVAEPTEAVQVVGVLPGRTERRVIVSAHFDTLNLSEDQVTGTAPGANDDASGIAVVLETARLLAGKSHDNTLVFACLSGEEQGLCGARALAQRARAEGWSIDAVLNHDMVGNRANVYGQADSSQIRVFSDDQSRELARWIEWVSRTPEFAVKLVLRHDRFGRGGDHTPFNLQGFPAVRFTEMYEENSRQHTRDDLPAFVDFDYVARVATANVTAMRRLANAMEPVSAAVKSREPGHSTGIHWEGAQAVSVFWRDTASATWQGVFEADGGSVVLELINIDDHEFAVSTGGVPVPVTQAQ